MILEVDAGNTRIKWRLMKSRDGRMEKVAEGSVFALLKAPSVFLELGQQLDKLPLHEITRTKVANVRGESFREAFSALMTEKWHLQPEFAAVERERGGVTNSYTDIQSMGVDRWLAMLAAYREVGGFTCVVDCGSAVTLDVVDATGQHQGGYIVPGLKLMRDTLGHRSRALRFETEPEWNGTMLGRTSVEAVDNGIISMLLALIERLRHDFQQHAPIWFLTGGDAAIMSRQLDWEHKVVPDLVMDGLSIGMD